MKTKLLSVLAASLLAVSPLALAAPTLLGTQVTIQYFDIVGPLPDPNPETVTVVPGAEILCGSSSSVFCDGVLFQGEFIDIGENSILLSLNTTTPFDDLASFAFGRLYAGTSTTIVGVSVSISNLTNLDEEDVTFTGNSVLLNMANVAFAGGDSNGQVDIRLTTFTELPVPEPIPEPSTYLLLGAGLLGLLALRRRSPARLA